MVVAPGDARSWRLLDCGSLVPQCVTLVAHRLSSTLCDIESHLAGRHRRLSGRLRSSIIAQNLSNKSGRSAPIGSVYRRVAFMTKRITAGSASCCGDSRGRPSYRSRFRSRRWIERAFGIDVSRTAHRAVVVRRRDSNPEATVVKCSGVYARSSRPSSVAEQLARNPDALRAGHTPMPINSRSCSIRPA